MAGGREKRANKDESGKKLSENHESQTALSQILCGRGQRSTNRTLRDNWPSETGGGDYQGGRTLADATEADVVMAGAGVAREVAAALRPGNFLGGRIVASSSGSAHRTGR